MSETFVVVAEPRGDAGKGASRRLRRLEGKLPAVVYGGNLPAQNISLIQKDFEHMLENEASYSSILDIQIDGKRQPAIIKDIQRHPAKDFPLHADFLRVSMDQSIKVNVPLHYINEDQCTGVKLGGGMIQKQTTDIEVQCLPGNLPEYIEVDMLSVELGQIVHLSDITLPEKVVSTALALGEDHDLAIASVVAPKGGRSDGDIEAQDGTSDTNANTDSSGASESAGDS